MSDERRDETRQGDRSSAQNEDAQRQPGTTALSTSDPAIKSSEAIGAPEKAVTYQTSHVSAAPDPYPFEAGGDVVQERGQQKRDGDKGAKKGDEQGKDNRQNGRHRGGERGSRQQGEHRGGDEESEQPRRKTKHAQTASAVNWKTLVMSAVLAVVCGVGGAWGYSSFFGASKSDEQDSDKKGSDKGDKGGGKSGDEKSGEAKSGGNGSGKSSSGGSSSEGGASASEIPGFSAAKDAETFRKELEHLSHRLDLLAGRIDQVTQPETQTPPVLHTLQEKVNELESEVDRVANLPHRFERLQQKLSSAGEEIKMLKERISGEEMPIGEAPSAQPENGPVADDRSATIAFEATGTANPADEATLKLAIGLFREGHYSQAYEVLRRLQRERPRDARVWYYSALANGMATGDWSGKTKRLAERGLACEKAGTPSRNDIDAALTNLPSGHGEDWLAEQRQAVVSR
ncbi:MAG TPA: hypothetical protein VG826_05670 [Pirellulales bacterium]|nr:hypothetical protein [Pirellulales bacterium]